MSLDAENENRLLKETIIELRYRLDELYMEMQSKVEKKHVELSHINLQLESTIQALREELVNSVLKNHVTIEEIERAKNLEISQLQDVIREMRKTLQACKGIEDEK